MNSANTKIIIYDDECPMCSAYTKAFVRTGFIKTGGRKSFSSINATLLDKIDNNRCRNEIPLIDPKTNTVYYGIDALLEILGDKISLIKIIGSNKAFNYLLKKFYNLISFNRRVITASKTANANFDCTPDFNLKYRLIFLMIGLLFNTIMLIPEHNFILTKCMFFHVSIMQLQSAHFAFVAVNILTAFTLPGKKIIEFLGQVNMLALLVTLLLIPLLLVNKYLHAPAIINNIYCAGLFIFIIKEYKRRLVYADVFQIKHIVCINYISLMAFFIYMLL